MRRIIAVIVLLFFAGAAALLAGHFGVIELPFGLTTGQLAKIAQEPWKTETAKEPAKTEAPSAEGRASAPAAASSEGRMEFSGTTLDISRISPEGSSVFAGHAKPQSYVTIYEGDKPVGSVKADENGEWSLVTEHKFASLDPNLTFRASAEPPPSAPSATTKVGEAQPVEALDSKTQPTTASPQAVASELMKKFEGLVAEAREEAKKEQQSADQSAATSAPVETHASSPSAPAQTPPPARQGSEKSEPRLATDAPRETASRSSPVPPSPSPTGTTIPVPIMFVYDEATFTEQGRRAVDLLIEYLRLKHLDSISLSGHADERGGGPYNMDLSRERLEAVERHLRDGGFAGHLDLIPKGETEPFTGVDRTKYSGEALFQFDRRVELRITR